MPSAIPLGNSSLLVQSVELGEQVCLFDFLLTAASQILDCDHSFRRFVFTKDQGIAGAAFAGFLELLSKT